MQAQQVLITDEVNAALRKHCRFCASLLPADDNTLLLKPTDDAATAYFHNSHTLLQLGRLAEADLFARLTRVVLKDTLYNTLYNNTVFLQAKIAFLNKLPAAATYQYEHFLTLRPADSVLLADANLSLAQAYLEVQNWGKTTQYLNAWHRTYLPFVGFKTKEHVYDSLATFFRGSKKINAPDSAIQLLTQFFTEGRDTNRLVTAYFNIADWFAPQAIEKSFLYAEKGLTLALSSLNLEQQQEGYLKLSLVEERRSRYKEALQYRKEYEILAERIRNTDAKIERRKRTDQRTAAYELQRQQRFENLKRLYIIISVLWAFVLLFFLPVSIRNLKNSQSLRRLRNELERLEQLNQSKDELFSIVSHDLRSAVHALQINVVRIRTLLAQLMTNTAVEVAEQTERLIGSLQSLLNNLLYWALSQIGQVSHRAELIALQPLLNGICYDLLPLAEAKGISLQYTLSDNFMCFADVNAMRIVFRNLIDNAIKYTPANGSVIISAIQEDHFCRITVQDSGIGMSQAIIDALFTASSRRIQQDASGRRSTGIGLWLAKNLTERNGGTLNIQSEEGAGTRITIALPSENR